MAMELEGEWGRITKYRGDARGHLRRREGKRLALRKARRKDRVGGWGEGFVSPFRKREERAGRLRIGKETRGTMR